MFDDGRWLGVHTDLAATSARVAERNPRDADTWRAMAAGFAVDAPHLFALLGTPMPSWALVRALFAMWRAKGLAGCMDTVHLLISSPRSRLGACRAWGPSRARPQARQAPRRPVRGRRPASHDGRLGPAP